ncbi:DUF1211 domain-containing protein, partial [bacterium]|nr:DUF1211 domain-containing protein [bacterium]
MDGFDALPVRNGFRQRGSDITRLETFTDAAFAFSVTMLVIAGGRVPGSYAELMHSLQAIPAFAASFALIIMFWHGHVQWSRRFGLEDGRSTLLSAVLIFAILVYIVPLKVLFGQMFAWMSGGRLGQPFPIEEVQQMTRLFVVYGLGYAAMSGTLLALNAHAYAQREELQLDERERFETRATMWQWTLLGIPGLLSVAVARVSNRSRSSSCSSSRWAYA